MRSIYALLGALIGALMDLGINLMAAAIQQRALQDQFSNQTIGWLVALIVIGLLLGIYLGKQLEFEVTEKPASTTPAKKSSTKRIQMTRLRALFSYNLLRGQGIELGDILSIGSVVIIDSRE